MERIIAVDPSGKLLHAIYQFGGRLIGVQVPTAPSNLDSWLYSMRLLRFTTLAYEDCYLSKNAKTFASLVSLRERVREAAAKTGISFKLITASEWQNALLIQKGEKRLDTGREVRKERAFHLARYILDRAPDSQDLADAACLWYYCSVESPVRFEELAPLVGDGPQCSTVAVSPLPAKRGGPSRSSKRNKANKNGK